MNETTLPNSTITIIANGQPRTVKAGSTIADFLQELNITAARAVALLNGEIVPRSAFAHSTLQEGSQLELVTLVGGG